MDEEMRQPEEMVSVIDGKKGQEILVGRYLNVVIVDHTDFMKLMLKEDYRIRHNFMMLIGQWFICLSSSSEWDERNEGSVKLSCKLKPELSKTNLWPWVTYGDSAPNEAATRRNQLNGCLQHIYLKQNGKFAIHFASSWLLCKRRTVHFSRY